MKAILMAGAAVLLLALNLNSFILMGTDKRRARRGEWRVPEHTLFLCAACFGALGGCLGMYVFRHKTKHILFKVLFPLFLLVQVVVIAYGYVNLC